ncbi:Acetylcholinesterase [Frankliniella fusca]|uniref:Acetylcholinesterase n=1 Tax=Frankliniella fusca TaxID=407009 RepID=A0AAE1I3B3_9NEOP|nr:Acetylcholinesterase [Frankliniella fusca]
MFVESGDDLGEDDPQDHVKLLFQMRVLTENRHGVLAYLGIPYAEPPVGELRFSAPARHRGWNGTLAATSFRPACPQPEQTEGLSTGAASDPARPQQDEDCLFLNVWSPEGATAFRPVPVIMILEGRGFVSGRPSALPAQDLAAEGVVVVSVSYRLNVFGFLCLGDGGARGNLGLLDQYLALLWVRDNIEAFGGDPRTVTLLGHGAGAASRAVLMSGSAASPWSRSPSATAASLGVARSLGCPLPPFDPYPRPAPPLRPASAPTLDCLRSKSTQEVLRAFLTQYQAGNWSDLPLPVSDTFLPPEEQYLPDDPRDPRSFHQVPVIAGVADQDGTLTLSEQRDLSRQSFAQLRRFVLRAAIPAVAKRYGFTSLPTRWPPVPPAPAVDQGDDGGDLADGAGNDLAAGLRLGLDAPALEVPVDASIFSLLEWRYVSAAAPGDASALLAGLLQMYTDAQFKAPHALQLRLLASRTSQLFAYRFDQPGPDLLGSGYPGAGFGSDLVLLLGPTTTRQLAGRRFTAQEERLSAYVKRMWVDFARTGNPTPGARGYGVSWRRYTEADQGFLSLASDGSQPLPMRSYAHEALLGVLGAAGPGGRELPAEAAAGSGASADARAAHLWNSFLPRLHNESISRRLAGWAASREAPLTNAQPFRSAMFTLLALVLLLLLLLVLCLVLLKRRAKERDRDRDSF